MASTGVRGSKLDTDGLCWLAGGNGVVSILAICGFEAEAGTGAGTGAGAGAGTSSVGCTLSSCIK